MKNNVIKVLNLLVISVICIFTLGCEVNKEYKYVIEINDEVVQTLVSSRAPQVVDQGVVHPDFLAALGESDKIIIRRHEVDQWKNIL